MPAEDTGKEETVETKSADLPSPEEFAKLQEDNAKSHEALTNVQGALTQANQRLEAFGDITPDTVKELLRLKQDVEAQQAGADPEQFNTLVEEKVAAVHADLGSKLEAKEGELQQALSLVHRYEVVNKVMGELGASVNDDVRDDVSENVARYVRKDESGAFYVVDESGNTRYSPTRASQKMTPEELFQEFEARKPSWFKQKGINKGSRQAGEINSGQSGAGSVNYERALTDTAYLNSLPFEQRKAVYAQWEKQKRG